MAKNLDGIKKISPDEMKKYRKEVLNYIGEKEDMSSESKQAKQTLFPRKSVDGLIVNKISDLKAAVKKQAEARKRIKAEERLYLLKQEREEKERVDQEKIRREAEVERIKELAAAKRKIKRQQAVRRFKKNLAIKLKEILSAVKRNFAYGLLLLVIFSAIGYLIFCLAILRFNITGGLAEKLKYYLPVPAVLSDQGIINYLDFRNLADKNYFRMTLVEQKKSLAEWIIIRNLKRKYDLPLDASAEELAIKFLADENFNRISLARIKKISQLLAEGGKMESLSKYADEYNSLAYYNYSQAREKFGQEILSLAVGEASGIIYRQAGYYLVVRVDDKDDQFSLRYLFVAADTLDRYLSDQQSKAKIFILAD